MFQSAGGCPAKMRARRKRPVLAKVAIARELSGLVLVLGKPKTQQHFNLSKSTP
jgi:hypothetical protein